MAEAASIRARLASPASGVDVGAAVVSVGGRGGGNVCRTTGAKAVMVLLIAGAATVAVEAAAPSATARRAAIRANTTSVVGR